MDNDADRKQYADSTKQLQKDWPTLTPDQRAQRLVANGNQQTAKQGVPPMGVNVKDMNANGAFDSSSWQMSINSAAVKPQLSDEDAAAVGDTVYHESRHSETTYAAARDEAANSKDLQTQQSTIPIRPSVNAQAMKKPMKPGDPGWGCAEAVKLSTFGPGAAQRNQTMRSLDPDQDALSKAQEEYSKAFTSRADAGTMKRLQANVDSAQAKYDPTYKAYRALPGESDAWAVGDKVGDMMDPPLPKK